MPTYAYRREDGTVFDAFQRITDPALTEDPETGQPVVRIISGGAGLQFKGSGFYLTDYGRGGKSDTAPGASNTESGKSESSKSDSGGSTAETKSDAKTATKTETKTESKAETKSESKPAAKPTD